MFLISLIKWQFLLLLGMLTKKYLMMLAKNVLVKRKGNYWSYHVKGLRSIRLPHTEERFDPYTLVIGSDLIFNPKQAVEKVIRATRKKKRPLDRSPCARGL